MNVTPINFNKITPYSTNKNINFNGNNKNQSNIITDNNGKEYVKVPKWQHDLTTLVFGVLIGLTVLQIIKELIKYKK